MTIGRRDVKLFGEKRSGGPLVILNTVHDEGEEVWEAVRTLTDAAFTLAAVSGLDWNDDMTPWPAPPAARWDSPYGGKADGYLEELSASIIPAIEEETGTPSYRAIAGYSLGGLFALYSLYTSTLFTSAVSASGSLWYPDFADYSGEDAGEDLPIARHEGTEGRKRPDAPGRREDRDHPSALPGYGYRDSTRDESGRPFH